VYVNGIRYDTSNTQIISADDGSVIASKPSDDELRGYLGLGQMIVLRGSSLEDGSGGVADAVYVDNQLVGPVTAGSVVDADGTFDVLGQTVTVTPDTIIDDSIIKRIIGNNALRDDVRFADIEQVTGQTLTLGELLANVAVIEVSGFVALDGVEATRIEDVNNRDRSNGNANSNDVGIVEVKGFVSNADSGQFDINGLTVFYDVQNLGQEFAGAGPVDGEFVEVKGRVIPNTASIDAVRIELEDGLPGNSSSSGASSSSSAAASSSSSSVGTSSSSSAAASSSSSAAASSSSAAGSSSSSAGASSSSSAATSSSSSAAASSSSSASGSRMQIEGIITDVRPDDATNTTGVIVINGLEISVNDLSQLSVGQRVSLKGILQDGVLLISLVKDSNKENVRVEDLALNIDSNGVSTRLGIAIDISDRTHVINAGKGSEVNARGYTLNDAIVWTRVQFKDKQPADCRLRGPVEQILGADANDFSFLIQGVNVDVSQLSDSDFRDSQEIAIGREAFFAQLGEGDIVQAKSIDNGCTDLNLVAREVEFEHSSDFTSSSSSAGASSSAAASSSSSAAASSSSSAGGASSSSSADDASSSSSAGGASSSSSASGASSSSSADDASSSSSAGGASSSSSAGGASSSSSADDASSSSSAGDPSSSSSADDASSSSSAGGASSSSSADDASSSSSAGDPSSSSSADDASSSSSAGDASSSSSAGGASSSSSADGASSSSSADDASSSSSAGDASSSSSAGGASSSSSAGGASSSSSADDASSSSSAAASSSSSAAGSSSSSADDASSSSSAAASSSSSADDASSSSSADDASSSSSAAASSSSSAP
jgi:hypothetical protein